MANSHEEEAVFTPNQRFELPFWKVYTSAAMNCWRFRHLIQELYKRDMIGNYRRSLIGLAWLLLWPMISILIWIFLHFSGFLHPGSTETPYGAYVLVGTTMWGAFMAFFNGGAQTFRAAQNLVFFVRFPHEIIFFQQVVLEVTYFAIALGLSLLFILCFGVVPAWQTIALPVVLVPLFFLGSALGLFSSLLSVVAVDLQRTFNRLVNALIFLTPIIYAGRIRIEALQWLVDYNPLTYLVCSARDLVLYGRLHDTNGFLICSGGSFVFFLISWRLFYLVEDKLVERIT